MRIQLFKKLKDGGPKGNSYAYFLIEWKEVFSVALLRFEGESREVFHTHAFNAISWVLKGCLRERERISVNDMRIYRTTFHKPSLKPIWTPRTCEHQVQSDGPAWAITFRGPWKDTWKEWRPKLGKYVGLTHGRKEFEID